MRSGVTVGLLVVALFLNGCDLKKFGVRSTAPVLKIGSRVLMRYQDPEFARQAAPASLATIEGMLEVDPENRILLELLARGLYEYTFAFMARKYELLQEDEPEKAQEYRRRARIHYLRVYEFGLRLLRLDGCKFTFQKDSIETIRKKIRKLGKRSVAGLVWTGVGGGGAVMMGMDKPWLLNWVSKIPVVLERAAELNPKYNHAMPVGGLAMYYARDRISGGSAIKSKKYFERAIALTKRKFLLWMVMYAEKWAWQFQQVTHEKVGRGPNARKVPVTPKNKKALFISLLKEVQRFPVNKYPSMRMANTLARIWGRRLMKRADEFLD